MAKKYLYGAAVQGLQSFIFQTDKLKEIVGGSELVEQTCTSAFRKVVPNYEEKNLMTGAAGNVKYLFDSPEDCQAAVYYFPRTVMEMAPGITISQAVVPVNDDPTQDDINKLEGKLKVQRNKVKKELHPALMIAERSRRTGMAAIKWDKLEERVLDAAQDKKQNAVDDSVSDLSEKLMGKQPQNKDFPFEVNDIAKGQKGSSNWIAVVHADGNNLGSVIQKMAKQLEDQSSNDLKVVFKEFSKQLDNATIKAAQVAYKQVVSKEDTEGKIPIRPIIIGGDDLTIIIRGDLALNFTSIFLEEFENATKEHFQSLVQQNNVSALSEGLTACAGIAYIKPTYPFHYAADLAEELCSYAKKEAKSKKLNQVPSSIMFHKVQSSFVENYEDIIKRELKANDVYFNYGPYAIQSGKDFPTVSKLKSWIYQINREDAPKSGLRNWLAELYNSKDKAAQLMDRIIKLNPTYNNNLQLNNAISKDINNKAKSHLYDVISLSSIQK